MDKLVVGHGYLGSRIAKRWRAAGDRVFATTRSAQRAETLAKEGFLPLVLDVTRPESLPSLPAAATVLYAVGYDPRAAASRHDVYVAGLQNVLNALPAGVERVIFISSSGVYGSSLEGWAMEDTPCRPDRESSQAIWTAEQQLQSHPLGSRAIILRLAGLYGPGRVPLLRDLKSGRPISVAADGTVNLIHVDDAVEAVLAAETRARPPRIFNVADGQPARRRDFYTYLAELLRLPPPEFVELPAEPGGARGQGQKRVSNARLLEELKFVPAYPSYREGLAAILSGEVP